MSPSYPVLRLQAGLMDVAGNKLAMSVSVFGFCFGPIVGKGQRAVLDFVPGKRHQNLSVSSGCITTSFDFTPSFAKAALNSAGVPLSTGKVP